MIKQTRSAIVLLRLLICLCLSSLAILPMLYAVGSPTMEMAASDAEHGPLFEQFELEDDLDFALISRAFTTGVSGSKHGAAQLSFQSALLSPVIPPPKPV
jgi:hypothetical protein